MCKPICADFPIAPIKNSIAISSITFILNPSITIESLCKPSTSLNISSKYKDPKTEYVAIIPKINPKSPTLFTINAFIAAVCADGL